jgi:uncharacterized protein
LPARRSFLQAPAWKHNKQTRFRTDREVKLSRRLVPSITRPDQSRNFVAGPVSISAPDRICQPRAAVPDAFNRGGTLEFAAISAVAHYHNDISNTLSTAPHPFQPMHRRKPSGDVERVPGARFYAAARPRLLAWAPLLDLSSINHGLRLPILLHCVDDHGRPPARTGKERARDGGISA